MTEAVTGLKQTNSLRGNIFLVEKGGWNMEHSAKVSSGKKQRELDTFLEKKGILGYRH